MHKSYRDSAAEVHHILPLRHGGDNKINDLMDLCKPCHSRITAEMGDRWAKVVCWGY